MLVLLETSAGFALFSISDDAKVKAAAGEDLKGLSVRAKAS